MPREARLSFIDGDYDYRRASARSRRLAGAARRETGLDAPAVLNRAAAERLVEARLRDAWTGRETLAFRISARRLEFEIGDHVLFPIDGVARLFRITGIEDGEHRLVTAVAAGRASGPARTPPPRRAARPRPRLPGRPFAVALDLPLARPEEGRSNGSRSTPARGAARRRCCARRPAAPSGRGRKPRGPRWSGARSGRWLQGRSGAGTG